MIRPFYALKLACTKLHSKRGVLITSIVVSSLLFAILISTVIIFTGAEKSALKFITKTGNDRYLVKVGPNIPHEEISFLANPSLRDIRAIRAYEKIYYEELRDKYESLGLEYDEMSEIPALTPSAFVSETFPEEQRVTVNFLSPAIQAMSAQRAEIYSATALNKLSDLKRVGEKYGATGYYLVDMPSELPTIPGSRLIQNGKEDFGDSELKAGNLTRYGYYTNAIYNSSYSFTDQRLLERYLLTTETSGLKGIPVVVSAQEAALRFGEILGIGDEPESASEKREWLSGVQKKLNGQTYQVCYRNSIEQAMLEKVQRDYAEMKNYETVEGYKKPSLIYDYPAEVCGDIIVKEDNRTFIEKKANTNEEDAKKKLGIYIAPSHQLLTFQIVGIKYAQPDTDYKKSVDDYVKSLLTSQDDSWSLNIPIQMYESLPDVFRIDYIQQQENEAIVTQQALVGEEFAERVLEFKTIKDARAFIDNETCPLSELNCDKQFLASPYGSNYLILDEISTLFNRIAVIAFPTVLGLAAVIIWLTISRIMTENRKEIAIYRAMGAKRHDIMSIYIVYTLLIALCMAIVSIILGLGFAFVVDYFYGKILTNTAVTAFGIIDNAPMVSLFDLESSLLYLIVDLIFVVSLIASIQPLIRSVRRSPIGDMRDDG